jgi:hypothetical protein
MSVFRQKYKHISVCIFRLSISGILLQWWKRLVTFWRNIYAIQSLLTVSHISYPSSILLTSNLRTEAVCSSRTSAVFSITAWDHNIREEISVFTSYICVSCNDMYTHDSLQRCHHQNLPGYSVKWLGVGSPPPPQSNGCRGFLPRDKVARTWS